MNARTRRVAASCAQLSRWLPAASCPAALRGAGPHCYTVLTKSTPYEQSTPSRMGGATDVVHRRCGRRPCEEMDDRVVEELRAFISQRYSSFMTSTLTFRHLKQHLSDTLG